MKLTLRLAYDETQHREAAAWFVVGGSAEAWLAELADWETPLAAARLYVVPTSLRDRTPCGVFVVGAAPRDRRASPRSIPYGAVEQRLFIPCEARLEPRLAEAELAALLGDDVYVWHPQAGLVVLPVASARRVHELLAAPPINENTWNYAVPGVALNAKLASLEPEVTPSADDVLNDARGDIGTQSPDLDRLPPTPNEPMSGPLGDAARAIGQGLAKAAQWIAQRAPSGGASTSGAGAGAGAGSASAGGGGGKPAWLEAVGNWAGRRLEQLSQSLEAARNRELHRLMNLLKDNPDEGLRFALPMGGDAHRGIAAPSANLGRRDVNFSLGGLGGGGPADYWNVPAEMQRRLLERYRELAAREIALGRHRRAAYIFATLLNDLRSAAATLEDGGHFREAAALYEERLKQPELAAACLRRGRCWTEAIALYERLGRHETVGDLYAELEQLDEAAAAWRRAVDVALGADDILTAAKLLEQKLSCSDEAFEHLIAAWPHAKQAQSCLTEAFALAARHDRHERAGQLVEQLTDETLGSARSASLATIAGALAADYPDVAVRELAADRTRMLAAARLGMTIDDSEAGQLVALVGRLVTEDRLLSRDGHRYLQQRRSQRSPTPTARSVRELTVFRDVVLPALDWRTAVASDDAIYIAGFRGRELVVMRTDWKGAEPEEAMGAKWEVEPGQLENPLMLAVDPAGLENVIVHHLGTPPLAHLRWFKATDRFPTPTAVGSHRGLSMMSYGICRSGRETVHIVDYDDGPALVARTYLSHAQLGGSSSIDLLKLSEEDWPLQYSLPVTVRNETLIAGIGRHVCFAREHGGLRMLKAPHGVTQLVAAPSQTRARLAIAMEQGGLLLWGYDERAAQVPFASEMVAPKVGFTREGLLIAASQDEIDAYATRDGGLKLHARLRTPRPAPLALVTTRATNHFAVLHVGGRLTLFDPPA